MHFGVDYGSRYAGTTVITYDKGNALYQLQCEKKSNADLFIKDQITALQPELVFIDAPLSLPGAYMGAGDNFHYRKADVELRAMSPMFLGGLTARAMSLKHSVEVTMIETYPSAFIRSSVDLREAYDKKDVKCISACLKALEIMIEHSLPNDVTSLHKLDSIIAWLSGRRYIEGVAVEVGDPKEGTIIY